MRVLLVNPPWRDEIKGRYGVRAGSRWPFTLSTPGGYKPFPFLLAYTISYLRQKGIDARLLDSIVLQHTYDHFFNEVDELSPNFVVIETSTPSIDNDLKIAEQLYKKGYKVILTGPHATVFAEDIIKLEFVDSVVKGEYERGIFERISSNKSGIYEYNIFDNLDELPFPYRDKETIFLYNDNPLGCLGHQVQVWSSRGCPFRCTFCLWPPVMCMNKFRQRSISNVIEEIEESIGRFGKNINIYFDDDTFNVGDKRTQGLARGIKGLGIEWAAMCRADTTSFDAFTVMRKCGCQGIKLGVESGCQELVNACNKKLNLKLVSRLCKHLRRIGMRFHLTFTFGLPGETKKTIEETINFAIRSGADSVQFSLTTPFPGTPYYRIAQNKGLKISNAWNDYDGAINSVVCEGLTDSALTKEILCQALKEAGERWEKAMRWRKRRRKAIRHIKMQPKR